MAAPSQSSLKGFSALVGATSLAIFLQAVTAGEFVSQDHRDGWIAAHDIVSNIVTVLALATMVFAIVRLRTASRPLFVGTIVLFVLVVIQSLLGHQITDNKQDWLIGVHVPLALIVFGIAVWLPIAAVSLRRAGTTTT